MINITKAKNMIVLGKRSCKTTLIKDALSNIGR